MSKKGYRQTKEHIETRSILISEALTGKKFPKEKYPTRGMTGKHHNNNSKNNISIKLTGRKPTEEAIQNMKKPKSEEAKSNMKGHTGVYIRTEKTKQNMSNSRIGILFLEERKKNMKGHSGVYVRTEKTKQKMRIARVEYIKNYTGFPVCPKLGKYERQILDKVQGIIGYNIIRQFYINGYFFDGYIVELNLVIEIDESYHYKNGMLSKHDIEKQESIVNSLCCNFLRIKVEEIVENGEVFVEDLKNKLKEILE